MNSIQWAKDNMPILSRIRKKFEEQKPFIGINIGVSMHLDSKTAVFLKTLQAGGADISASSCNPLSTDDGVAAALSKNMEIFAMLKKEIQSVSTFFQWVLYVEETDRLYLSGYK